MKHPYPLPHRLSPALTRGRDYWRGLLRGEATMPFWDDVRLNDLADIRERLVLIDVFEKPERFRFNSLGDGLGAGEFGGLFLDETRLGHPLEFLRSQCAATVEAGEPTFMRWQAGTDDGYGRLLLPLWGEGHIAMLMGVIEAG